MKTNIVVRIWNESVGDATNDRDAAIKFAEAILQECIDVLNPEGEPVAMSEEHWRFAAIGMIRRHFGMK